MRRALVWSICGVLLPSVWRGLGGSGRMTAGDGYRGRGSRVIVGDGTGVTDDRNEPENDFGPQSVEPEPNDSELVKQSIEPEQVRMHGQTLVDDDKNGRNEMAHTSVNHGGPTSEMTTPPQADSPSVPQNELDEAPLDPNIRQSERL